MASNINNILNLRISLLCWAIYLLPIQIDAQPSLWFNHLSIEEGLTHANVNAILQDSEGFIWIATFDGLCKYDGYRVTTYSSQFGDSTTLVSNLITDIIEDKDGYLWVSTTNGISRFDKKTKRFSNLTHRPGDRNTISHNSVWSLMQDNKGRIWAGTFGGGLNRIENPEDFPNVQITHFENASDNPKSLSQNWVMDIYEDNKGRIWIGTVGNYLNRYVPERNHFDRILLADDSHINNSVWKIEEDNTGRLWLGTETGLSRYDPEQEQIRNFVYDEADSTTITEGQIRAICFDSNNNLWVGTQFGLNLYDPKHDRFSHYLHDEIDIMTISSDEAWCIEEDNQGNIWIGTYSGGVSYFHPSYTSFAHVTYNPLNKQGIQGNNITGFSESPEGNLWIAIDHSGLDYWDRKKNKITHYRPNGNGEYGLSSSSVMEVFQDSEGYVWTGIYYHGLNRLDPKTGIIKKYPANPAHKGMLNNGNVWAIEEDSEGNLWIGTIGGGLNLYDRATDTFSNFGWDFNDTTALSHENVWSLLLDGDSLVWVGTNQGLNILNRETGIFKRYLYDPSDSTSLQNNTVQALYKDSKNRIWIGTQGGGLNRLNRKTGEFESISKKDGLSSENIAGILEDKNGNLWVSTNEGISKINTETYEIRNFSTGLKNNQFNLESCIRTEDGYMYFGGTNGFNSFHPDSIVDIRQESKVAITDFQVFNQSENMADYMIESMDSIPTLELKHTESVFSFEFSALNYIASEQVNYAYRLYNFEKEWIVTNSNRRFVTYTNIPAGEYMLSIKATDTEGVWMDQITYLRIVINPPWWMTWWFRVYMTLAVITVIYFAYQVRMKFIYNQKRALEEEVKNRTAEVVEQKEALQHQAQMLQQYNQDILSKNELLKDLHRQKDGMIGIVAHDLRSPLNNIKGLVNLLKKSNDEEEEQKYYKLINQLIDQGTLLISDLLYVSGMKQFDIKLNIESFDIKEYIGDWLDNYKTDLEKKEQILDLDFPLAGLMVESDKDVLRRILDNIFTNAMKFSERGKLIHMGINPGVEEYSITITDQGPGISEEDKEKMFEMFQKLSAKPTEGESSSGLGLSIVKALVEKLRGRIEVESELGKGTSFIMTFPIKMEWD
ncbi:ligand-binding sensor domain-containing protein [Reichenbachiella ulvae]|uniref:histidine kinase n=1 Tax=Reichenbachiella ulvae TaxID=2980104 RepID=A0ABT3D0J5_9BACT|nr:sensor histidine kinase [Reichenbachiella ulvae]MCV9389339.1 ATP-binding protein [Reichenbachiella ulvae]